AGDQAKEAQNHEEASGESVEERRRAMHERLLRVGAGEPFSGLRRHVPGPVGAQNEDLSVRVAACRRLF
ncbi:MAG: hypothetical protein R3F43_23430, partial [bacterium]